MASLTASVNAKVIVHVPELQFCATTARAKVMNVSVFPEQPDIILLSDRNVLSAFLREFQFFHI